MPGIEPRSVLSYLHAKQMCYCCAIATTVLSLQPRGKKFRPNSGAKINSFIHRSCTLLPSLWFCHIALKTLVLTMTLDIVPDSISHFRSQASICHHFMSHIFPRHLYKHPNISSAPSLLGKVRSKLGYEATALFRACLRMSLHS